jgi:3-phosphoglycerate kinase
MKTINDFEVKNKRVLVRCDFNVPFDEKGNIENDFRIRQTLPTIEYLIKKGAKVVLMSHLADDKSLDPVWERVRKYVSGDIKFLDNLRLNKGEEKNSEQFARELALNADIYVNDAFGVCHREHASVVAITKFLPSAAGLLLEKEIKVLSGILDNPARPMVAVIGGAKISSKSVVIQRFLDTADHILIGGKIANFLLAVQGIAQDGFTPEEKKKMGDINLASNKIHLPIDAVTAKGLMAVGKVEKNDFIFDIGRDTISVFSNIIKEAGTIIWAGPLGFFEKKPYGKGTRRVAEAICKNKKAFKLAGGGETIAAIADFKLEKGFNHISTGGGAMLAFLAGEELPGLKALGYYGGN